MHSILYLGRSETAKTLISELICSPMTSATIGRRLNSEDEFEVDADALLDPINAGELDGGKAFCIGCF